jgi:hypothetical protein
VQHPEKLASLDRLVALLAKSFDLALRVLALLLLWCPASRT